MNKAQFMIQPLKKYLPNFKELIKCVIFKIKEFNKWLEVAHYHQVNVIKNLDGLIKANSQKYKESLKVFDKEKIKFELIFKKFIFTKKNIINVKKWKSLKNS